MLHLTSSIIDKEYIVVLMIGAFMKRIFAILLMLTITSSTCAHAFCGWVVGQWSGSLRTDSNHIWKVHGDATMDLMHNMYMNLLLPNELCTDHTHQCLITFTGTCNDDYLYLYQKGSNGKYYNGKVTDKRIQLNSQADSIELLKVNNA